MFLDDIASRLVSQGVGTLGVNIFISSQAKMPSPSNYPPTDATQGMGPYITISETGGMAPTRTQNKVGAATLRPTAQVLVRAGSITGVQEGYTAARAMSLAAYLALDGLWNVVLNGITYVKVAARQEPTDMGIDTSGQRVQIVFNIEAEKQPS